MQNKFPSVSVIIPVKNEAVKIRACIDGILSQTVPVAEIIVIDSGSTDETVAILRSYKEVTLIEIPGTEFNHGATRNLGVSKATGEFVLLTVGDARPYNNFWIEELLNGFVDEEVAGVCGQQVVPHETDKNPVEWFRPVDEPKLKRQQFKEAGDFEALSPLEKMRVCGWDDVTAMYRRSVLRGLPFRKTSYSEDAIWARDAILQGHAIVYNHKARVYHYHLEDADFTFKRTFTTIYFRYKYFGYVYPQPNMPVRKKLSILRQLIQSVGLRYGVVYKWYRYNVDNFMAILHAHRRFTAALAQGETVLDAAHEELCGKPPIPLKTT